MRKERYWAKYTRVYTLRLIRKYDNSNIVTNQTCYLSIYGYCPRLIKTMTFPSIISFPYIADMYRQKFFEVKSINDSQMFFTVKRRLMIIDEINNNIDRRIL